MSYQFEITSRFNEAERAAIFDPLIEFNTTKAGEPDYLPLNVLLQDNNKKVIGGLWGHTAFNWLCIELLFFPEHLRNKGYGSAAVKSAELEAVSRGCGNAWLDTHEFQSKGFYEAMGYSCFGELPDYPKGFARYFMRKVL